MTTKELRVLQVQIPEPESNGNRVGIRQVSIIAVFSDGTWSQIKAHSSLNPWPSEDLLNTVKGFVAELERD